MFYKWKPLASIKVRCETHMKVVLGEKGLSLVTREEYEAQSILEELTSFIFHLPELSEGMRTPVLRSFTMPNNSHKVRFIFPFVTHFEHGRDE